MTLPQANAPCEAAGPAREDDRVAMLTEAVAARDRFIAVAAHELRNPMTPMIGQIELLLKGVKAGTYPPQQIEERLERVLLSMRHYLKRAGILLDVSRIASGKLHMTAEPCDLVEIVRLVAEAFDATARHAGAHLEINTPPALHGSWDRMALEQVVDNLISNAIKYGGKNAVIVSVQEASDGAAAIIRVRDHGPGISARNKERIFGRFERVLGSDEAQTGFGVGLWVVGQIVDAMAGKIAVNDAVDGGTVFEVVLPKRVESDLNG